MIYININVSTLDSDAWLRSDLADHGVWLALMRYCYGQENGGSIHGCRTWTDAEWRLICRVSKKDVTRNSLLWNWEGDNLVVNFYPESAENRAKKQRQSAYDTHAKRSANHDGNHGAKEKERKEKEKQGNGTMVAECPSDGEVQEFASSWVGEPASGTPAMDREWVLRWLSKMNARSGDWPRDWRRAMIAAWRTDFRAGSTNGNGKPATTWELRQALDVFKAKLAKHPGNRDSSFCIGDPTEEEEEEVEKIKKEISRLEGLVGA